jgi:macrolide transport system ATP-binding/permease protein
VAPSAPLLELERVRREFPAGEGTVCVLHDIDLTIDAGEMVAIVGASGSGKSTLMNILGCLDRATSGSYRIAGVDTATLGPDALAALRREHFGFVFQRYHLMNDLSALSNVETPAIYSGTLKAERHARAALLLARLGLEARMHHRPNQLSGGQQQRVSIARALMNGGQVILADEPTGALDKHAGQEMLKILEELHEAGHTVVIVTHDMHVAEHAARIIEISDGEIIADRRRDATRANAFATPPATEPDARQTRTADWGRLREALSMALIAMRAHRLRTFLTMLGIIIGIAAVVSVVALGEGSRRQILEEISSIGTNTIDVYPGKGYGDMHSQSIHTLIPSDAEALGQQSYVDSVTPAVTSSLSLRHGNVSVSATVNGVGEDYFRVHGLQVARGIAFDRSSVRREAQEVLIDDKTALKLFALSEDPLGQVILLGNVPCRVIGITTAKPSIYDRGESLSAWVPYTTAMVRITGQPYLRSITVRISESASTHAAEQGINRLLKSRHGIQDFFLYNTDTIRQSVETASATLTLLISAIAVISLIVGGFGVMNIMLVSVTERTREIGVRMAVGARQADIMQQFLIEAVLVCLFGGALGIGLSLLVGVLFAYFARDFRMAFSPTSMLVAFACSTLIGIVFGFLPARNAARLDPIEALARD